MGYLTRLIERCDRYQRVSPYSRRRTVKHDFEYLTEKQGSPPLTFGVCPPGYTWRTLNPPPHKPAIESDNTTTPPPVLAEPLRFGVPPVFSTPTTSPTCSATPPTPSKPVMTQVRLDVISALRNFGSTKQQAVLQVENVPDGDFDTMFRAALATKV